MSDFGKKFESKVKSALLAQKVCFDRLPDQMSGFAGSANPADFTAFQKPFYFYIECKSVQSNNFDIRSMITEYQWITLQAKSQFKGVVAGYLIWFVNEGYVFWIDAVNMKEIYKVKRSFSVEDLFEINIKSPWLKSKAKQCPKMTKLLSTLAALSS